MHWVKDTLLTVLSTDTNSSSNGCCYFILDLPGIR